MFGLGYYLDNNSSEGGLFFSNDPPIDTPVVKRPTIEPDSSQTAADQRIVAENETLNVLKNSEVPVFDSRDLAMRLEGKLNIPLTINPPITNFDVGSQQDFWVSNVDENEYYEIRASLAYITDHVYFWIQEEVPFILKMSSSWQKLLKMRFTLQTGNFLAANGARELMETHIYISCMLKT